jgi:hypothetical protein
VIRITDLETMDRAALLAGLVDCVRRASVEGDQPPLPAPLPRLRTPGPAIRRTAESCRGRVHTERRHGARETAYAALKPGGRLIREWNGVTHVVDVTETGFLWKGETWRSLSSIAREITGAHWSGPRFFGLNGTAAS